MTFGESRNPKVPGVQSEDCEILPGCYYPTVWTQVVKAEASRNHKRHSRRAATSTREEGYGVEIARARHRPFMESDFFKV